MAFLSRSCVLCDLVLSLLGLTLKVDAEWALSMRIWVRAGRGDRLASPPERRPRIRLEEVPDGISSWPKALPFAAFFV